jgi:hypothetical protein
MSFNIGDQRKEKRIQVKFPASISWLDHSGQEINDETFTLDVSNSGMSLITRQRPAVGNKVTITLDTGGILGSSIAEVKWTRRTVEGFRIGLSFKLAEA